MLFFSFLSFSCHYLSPHVVFCEELFQLEFFKIGVTYLKRRKKLKAHFGGGVVSAVTGRPQLDLTPEEDNTFLQVRPGGTQALCSYVRKVAFTLGVVNVWISVKYTLSYHPKCLFILLNKNHIFRSSVVGKSLLDSLSHIFPLFSPSRGGASNLYYVLVVSVNHTACSPGSSAGISSAVCPDQPEQ